MGSTSGIPSSRIPSIRPQPHSPPTTAMEVAALGGIGDTPFIGDVGDGDDSDGDDAGSGGFGRSGGDEGGGEAEGEGADEGEVVANNWYSRCNRDYPFMTKTM